MNTILKLFLSLFLILTISIGALCWTLIDTQPTNIQTSQINATNAEQSKRLAKRLIYNIKYAKDEAHLSLMVSEIDGLLALLHRAIPALTAQVRLINNAGYIQSSYRLPKMLDKFYINWSATVLSSNEGIDLAAVKIGGLTINGDTALWLLSTAIDWYIAPDTSHKLLTSIKQINIKPSGITANVLLDKALLEQQGEKSLFVRLRDDLALFGDAKLIKYYYDALVSHAALLPNTLSLDAFIHHLFSLAVSENRKAAPASYIAQNKAILVAIVLYFGTDKFELLVGNVKTLPKEAAIKRYHHRGKVLLAGRNDLQKHFVYSIALQLLSDNQTSDALGEFKEFLDANKGGSGFSFVDLLADRAGTRLAMIATHSEQQAKAVQPILASAMDKDLLPSIAAWEEGISTQRFERQYQDVTSSAYKQMLNALDEQLKTLPLYQFDWNE